MRIFIPTRGRWSKMNQGTMKFLPINDFKRTIIVVHSSELEQYTRVLTPHLANGLTIIPMTYNTLPEKKHLIGQYAQDNGITKFCLFDDDLDLLIRIKDDDWRMRNQTNEDTTEMFNYIEGLLTVFAHGALSPREGNNRIGNGSREELLITNTRAMRAHFFRTKEFLSIPQNRLLDVEDFDNTLSLLEAGYENVVPYWYASGQKKTNADGGCSLYRNNELHDQEIRKLQSFHPGFVFLRTKSNKTDKEGFGTRTEVNIQWKKAYLSSRS